MFRIGLKQIWIILLEWNNQLKLLVPKCCNSLKDLKSLINFYSSTFRFGKKIKIKKKKALNIVKKLRGNNVSEKSINKFSDVMIRKNVDQE